MSRIGTDDIDRHTIGDSHCRWMSEREGRMMPKEMAGSPPDEAFETERAAWFLRMFYGREQVDDADVSRIKELFHGHSTRDMLHRASQMTEFHSEARVLQNFMLNSIYRKRNEYLTRRRIERIVPNLFVIGQPRSGTTSLHEYFHDHPSVYVPSAKETDYYSHYCEARRGRLGLRYEDYLMHFIDAEDEPIRCDISPFYASEPGVALHIYRDNPDARIILILRDPIDLIVSKFNLDHGDAPTGAIDAWITEGLVQYRDKQPRWQHDSFVTTLFHCRISRTVEEFMRYFGSRMRIYLFDDMVRDQKAAYADICRFLGIPFVYDRAYWAWRSAAATRPGPAALRELAAFLRPDVLELEAVIGRDLSSWYSQWPA